MTRYQLIPRRKDERGIFAIYPKGTTFWAIYNDILLDESHELARVKARTPMEALRLAAKRGIATDIQIETSEILPASRVIALEA